MAQCLFGGRIINIAELKSRLSNYIWANELDTFAAPHRWFIHFARTLYVLTKDLAEGQLTLRAMSLVYTTLLSLVPLLAVSFSILKGFGVHNQLEPMLLNFLAPMGDRGVEITEKVIGFVSNVKAGVLGSLGLILLLYTVVSLIQKIEHAFNYVWHVSDARSIIQRFSNYLSITIIGPVLVFTAMGITATAQSNSIVEALRTLPFVSTLFDAIGYLLPYLLMVIAFTVVYMIVPNTRVRLTSALVGGATAGILWQTTGWAFAAFVVNSAKYTAIYSAFASLILFMIWLYAGWLILLTGSSIAFYHQHPEYLKRNKSKLRLGNHEQETLALQVMLLAGGAFHRGDPPITRSELVHNIKLPADIVEPVIRNLCSRNLLRELQEPPGIVPTRSLERIPLIDILEAVRGTTLTGGSGMVTNKVTDQVSNEIDNAIKQSVASRSVLDMIESPSASMRDSQREENTT